MSTRHSVVQPEQEAGQTDSPRRQLARIAQTTNSEFWKTNDVSKHDGAMSASQRVACVRHRVRPATVAQSRGCRLVHTADEDVTSEWSCQWSFVHATLVGPLQLRLVLFVAAGAQCVSLHGCARLCFLVALLPCHLFSTFLECGSCHVPHGKELACFFFLQVGFFHL